jgi:hypothetical protein
MLKEHHIMSQDILWKGGEGKKTKWQYSKQIKRGGVIKEYL